MFYILYVVFFYAVNYYQGFKEKLRNEGKLKSLVKEAELHALKSQINPHFLFNSLNSISSLTMTDPVKAQEMVINLSQLMRYSLKHDQNERVTFQQEIENIPPWVMVLLIAGWLLPTPTTMFNFIAKLFKRKDYVRQHEKNNGQEKEVNNQKENRCAGD